LYIEVKLTVKGPTESEDKDLSFLVVPFACGNAAYSYHNYSYRTSKLSTVRLSLGPIVASVEATIFVRVSDGSSWPDGFRAQFAAFTTGIRRKIAPSIDHKKIILLDSGSRKVPVTADGRVVLSRRVVSVETGAKLRVCVKARVVEKFFWMSYFSHPRKQVEALVCLMLAFVRWKLRSPGHSLPMMISMGVTCYEDTADGSYKSYKLWAPGSSCYVNVIMILVDYQKAASFC